VRPSATVILFPAAISFILGTLEINSPTGWGTWISCLVVSSLAILFLWKPIVALSEYNIGSWLGCLSDITVLFGVIVTFIIAIVVVLSNGGNLLLAVGSMVSWIIVGAISSFVLGRVIVALYA
jgi:hypothetical protein